MDKLAKNPPVKKLCVLMATPFVLSVLANLVFAIPMVGASVALSDKAGVFENKDINFRQIIIHSVAYCETRCVSRDDKPENQYNHETENYLARLNDKELVELARKNLSSVINRKQAGEQIIWNASFVEKVVKQYFPELYSEIAEQLTQDTNSATSDHTADVRAGISGVQPLYNPGSTEYNMLFRDKDTAIMGDKKGV